MPWKEVSIMSARYEFVRLATQEGANIRQLCRRSGISPTTGYKLLVRFQTQGAAGLRDRSRKPETSPHRTPLALERRILTLRDTHPRWGARKLWARLKALGHTGLPTPSTIQAILTRHGRIDPTQSRKHQAFIRFEHEAPNDLWQMDFKGHFALGRGRCHPLTVLDDHSRFSVCLSACANEQGVTVQARLTDTFRSYGLPDRMTMDNGSPWGDDAGHPYTPVTVWLLRLGIRVSHSRPYHPQTQGKDERFHRTLNTELLQGRVFATLAETQSAFDAWRAVYNLERPHEALSLQPPISRYAPSTRSFPEVMPPIEYGPTDIVRKVQAKGEFSFHNHSFRIAKAFRGYPVALRPTNEDGLWNVFFCMHAVASINLKSDLTDKPYVPHYL